MTGENHLRHSKLVGLQEDEKPKGSPRVIHGPASSSFSSRRNRRAHQSGKHRECSQETLTGTYGIQLQGTSATGPSGPIESTVGVVIRTYDGEGQFTQIANVRGSISGIVLDRPGSGAYEVNADCSAVARFQPAPGVVLEERLVIVDDGNEIRSGSVLPLPNVVTGIQRRIDVR